MHLSSIIHDTVQEETRTLVGAALLEALAAEQAEPEIIEIDEEPIEEPAPPPTWQERWAAEAAVDDTADAILAATWIQAQQIRRQSETEGHAEGYATGYGEGHVSGRADGYTEGFAEGHGEGLATARAEGAEALHRATEVAAATELDRRELLKAAEGQLVSLVIAVAKRVVQAEVQTNPELVRQCVQAAVRAIGESPVATLHLNPDDVELLEDMWTELRERFGQGGLQIVPDARIQRGGVIVDAENRTVDAQIESRLAEVERQFRIIAETNS